jgi:hypothetical protein
MRNYSKAVRIVLLKFKMTFQDLANAAAWVQRR